MFAEKFSNREAERNKTAPSNKTRPRIQRLPATHLKLIERARSNQGNTVFVCSLPPLYIPVCSDLLCLQTDVSGVSSGAVLSLRHDDKELPTAYYSRKLSSAECNYSATEFEGLAVVLI